VEPVIRPLLIVAAALPAALLLSGSQPPPTKIPSAPLIDPAAMVELDGGTFLMGVAFAAPSPYGDAWFIDQTPQHSVTLSPFAIERFEVSVAQYAAFLRLAGGAANHHPAQPIEAVDGVYVAARGETNRPMRQVRHTDARAYCAWAGMRLPTEAEFEFAATNGGTTDVPYDTSTPQSGCSRANHFTGAVACYGEVLAVDALPDGRSEAGVYHLAGNVAEWTADRYGDYSAEAQTDPDGNTFAALVVTRGGGHLDTGQFLRGRARRPVNPRNRSDNLGFRCVLAGAAPSEPWRGELAPPDPAILARRATAPPIDEARTVLDDDLIFPQLITPFAGAYAVSERGRERIVLTGDGSSRTLVDGVLAEAMLVTDDTLVVAVRDAARLIGVRSDGELRFDVALAAEHLAQLEGTLAAASARRLHTLAIAEGTAVEVPWPHAAIAGLTTHDGSFWVLDEAGQLASVRDGQAMPEGRASWAFGGTPRQLFSDGSSLWTVVRAPRWPDWGTLCRIPVGGGSLDCVSYSPPKPRGATIVGDTVTWATAYTLSEASAAGGDPFGHAVAETRPGGFWRSPTELVWTDEHLGQLIRLDLSR
jgi:formylglycine-generating enzyme required for sulfatase activity